MKHHTHSAEIASFASSAARYLRGSPTYIITSGQTLQRT